MKDFEKLNLDKSVSFPRSLEYANQRLQNLEHLVDKIVFEKNNFIAEEVYLFLHNSFYKVYY